MIGDGTSERAESIYQEARRNVHERADRLFAWLMGFQWLAGITAAVTISPRTWIGLQSEIHWHVWAAIFLGGAIASFPIFMALKFPGRAMTRHVIAVAQMVTSALLIHLTGGRIETHFHVFGSLAFLAFYRDWRVLVTGTIVVAVDHLARGVFWPQSVFGILTPSPWRWTEHAGWVIFEDTFLIISIKQSLKDMIEASARRATLELVNVRIEREVAARTSELQASEQRFRTLSAAAPIGIFETDAAGEALYTNEYWQNIAERSPGESLGGGWKEAVHPEDRAKMLERWKRAVEEQREFDSEIRYQRRTGEVRWVHVRSTARRGPPGEVLGHIGTVEDITERKRAEEDLEAAHRKLLDTSRRAGMAEVATGVLHNVGNVLNSVNVSATLLSERLKKSKVSTLDRLAATFRDHAHDLTEFLATDDRGKKLPGFLSQVARQVTAEQGSNLTELESLRRNIEHIKDIVAMQQSYAKVSGVEEIVSLASLVEDALRINAGGLARGKVEVAREFEAMAPVSVEKHAVLQILVNLIRNAKQACEVSGTAKKQIVIRIGSEPGCVRIRVIDNGIGIAPEHLARVFEHGFTTKKDGHGFGLHSGANAAKAFGGSLIAASGGAGLGACFTLTLPVEPAAAGNQATIGTTMDYGNA